MPSVIFMVNHSFSVRLVTSSKSRMQRKSNTAIYCGRLLRGLNKEWRPLLRTRKVEAAILKRVGEILWKVRVLEFLCIVLEHLCPIDKPYSKQEWKIAAKPQFQCQGPLCPFWTCKKAHWRTSLGLLGKQCPTDGQEKPPKNSNKCPTYFPPQFMRPVLLWYLNREGHYKKTTDQRFSLT